MIKMQQTTLHEFLSVSKEFIEPGRLGWNLKTKVIVVTDAEHGRVTIQAAKRPLQK